MPTISALGWKHLGSQDEQQECALAAEPVPGRVVRRGQRDQGHQDRRAAGPSRLIRRLEVMPKPEPHMPVRFDQAQWCGR